MFSSPDTEGGFERRGTTGSGKTRWRANVC